ncbi:MAG: hypothetical protein SGPRY_000808, partial [Prymnesium sp.]
VVPIPATASEHPTNTLQITQMTDKVGKKSPYCKTDERLLAVVQAANQLEYFKALPTYGSKRKCPRPCAHLAGSGDLPNAPSLDTMLRLIQEEALAQRRAAVGKTGKKDHIGGVSGSDIKGEMITCQI